MSFFKALGQMSDPRFLRVMLYGVGLTIALLVAVTTGFLMFLQWLSGDTTTLPLIGEVRWLDDLVSWSGLFLMLFLSIFLMIPVASAITSMFLDTVAQAVEDRHHPTLPPAQSVTLWEAFRDTVNFFGIVMVANFFALILYVLFAPAALLIFWLLNGYLLGMEYFQLVAMRRLGRKQARAMRKRHRGTIWLGGILMAIPLMVPLLNLVIPILGAATFTHIFHALRQSETLQS